MIYRSDSLRSGHRSHPVHDFLVYLPTTPCLAIHRVRDFVGHGGHVVVQMLCVLWSGVDGLWGNWNGLAKADLQLGSVQE